MKDRIRKPEWLKISIGANERYTETKRIVESHCLHTICSSGRCPNMGECWGKGTATFMIGGDICTRCCKFCNTQTGKPLPLDMEEPTHVAESIALMKLSHNSHSYPDHFLQRFLNPFKMPRTEIISDDRLHSLRQSDHHHYK